MNRCKSARGFMLVAIAVLALLAVTDVHAAGNNSPTTMDDMLNSASIGKYMSAPMFSPNGDAFTFVREVPMAQQNNWGYDDADLVRSRVFVMRRNGSTPREIPNTADVHYDLAPEGAWSPDSRELLLIATTRKGYGLAVYDLASGKITILPGYLDNFFPTFDWTRDGRIVYFALPEGVHQRGADNQVLENVSARWRAAWNGSTPQVSISSTSPVFKTSEVPPGSLMLADPRRGISRKLATGNYYKIAVTPDGRRIAAVRGAEPLPTSLNFHGRRGELQIFELSKKNQARLLYRYGNLDASANVVAGSCMSWSPSGTRLLFVGAPVPDGKADASLYVADGVDGKLHRIVGPGLSFINPGAGDWGMTLPVGWLAGRPIAVATRQVKSVEQAPRNSGSAAAHLDYGETQHLRFDVYAFGANGAQDLTAFAKASVNQFLVPQGETAALVVANGALWRLDSGHAPVRLSPHDAMKIVGFGIDARYPAPSLQSAYYRSGSVARIGLYALSVKGKPDRVVLDLKTGRIVPLKVRGKIVATAPDQLTTLSKLDAGWTSSLLFNSADGSRAMLSVNSSLKDKAVAPVKSFQFTYKGKTLVGWLVMPPNAKPNVPQPAIVSVYGGIVYGSEQPSETRTDTALPIFSGQLLAAQGYAVVYPSTPLGPGSSTDVMSTLAGEAVAAVDALAAKGIIDPKRVGVIGQSFGGYSTAAILAERSDRFKAGIAMAGVYDWVFGWGMQPMGRLLTSGGDIFDPEITMTEIGQIRLGKPFWQSPAAYMRNSPTFRVEHINAPLLFLHGDLDLGVTGLPGVERMYNAMLMAGKTTALVRYWGQGHVAQSAWAIRDQWSRITRWFGHYLKNAPDGAH